jgi:hypothetical protein
MNDAVPYGASHVRTRINRKNCNAICLSPTKKVKPVMLCLVVGGRQAHVQRGPVHS